jgi:hypothetical protein
LCEFQTLAPIKQKHSEPKDDKRPLPGLVNGP